MNLNFEFVVKWLSHDLSEQMNMSYEDLAARYCSCIYTETLSDGKTMNKMYCRKCFANGCVEMIPLNNGKLGWDNTLCRCEECGEEYMLYERCCICDSTSVKRVCVDKLDEDGRSLTYGVCAACDSFFEYNGYYHDCGSKCEFEHKNREELILRYAEAMKKYRKDNIAKLFIIR